VKYSLEDDIGGCRFANWTEPAKGEFLSSMALWFGSEKRDDLLERGLVKQKPGI
jgi:hypothetical protein